MIAPCPHYLLLSTCESESNPRPGTGQPGTGQQGTWRFVLEELDGDERVDIRDSEPGVCGERLELLSVIRGLEALDQPSRVTLVTPSRYVIRGIRFGLETWKRNEWQWEVHGEHVPVKDCDLWLRLDRALDIHEIRLRHWRAEVGHERQLADSAITTHHDDYSPAVAG